MTRSFISMFGSLSLDNKNLCLTPELKPDLAEEDGHYLLYPWSGYWCQPKDSNCESCETYTEAIFSIVGRCSGLFQIHSRIFTAIVLNLVSLCSQ